MILVVGITYIDVNEDHHGVYQTKSLGLSGSYVGSNKLICNLDVNLEIKNGSSLKNDGGNEVVIANDLKHIIGSTND